MYVAVVTDEAGLIEVFGLSAIKSESQTIAAKLRSEFTGIKVTVVPVSAHAVEPESLVLKSEYLWRVISDALPNDFRAADKAFRALKKAATEE